MKYVTASTRATALRRVAPSAAFAKGFARPDPDSDAAIAVRGSDSWIEMFATRDPAREPLGNDVTARGYKLVPTLPIEMLGPKMKALRVPCGTLRITLVSNHACTLIEA